MVVRIRMSMLGSRNNKFFNLVAINGKQRRDAKPLETLGVYRPRIDQALGSKYKTVEWSADRIRYWLKVGAQPSKSAARLLELGGILPSNNTRTAAESPTSTTQSGPKNTDQATQRLS
ncbi:ribosomal protein S16 [Rickenella mellea]|uniref:Ribosomal protein S16 n=1 Tax=Rickenella mellea TaxID=50990 RepID=A0A4Y7QN73_9AGAM|nr:ribosomal protein S16 [Rickenella mellea]